MRKSEKKQEVLGLVIILGNRDYFSGTLHFPELFGTY